MFFNETNPWTTNSLLHAIFIIRSDENCFAASSRRIFPFSFVKKPPRWRNSDEMLAMKNRFAETTDNDLHTIRVLPTFCCFVVYSGPEKKMMAEFHLGRKLTLTRMVFLLCTDDPLRFQRIEYRRRQWWKRLYAF